MKVLLVLFVATVAVVFAGYDNTASYAHYEPGLRHVYDHLIKNFNRIQISLRSRNNTGVGLFIN